MLEPTAGAGSVIREPILELVGVTKDYPGVRALAEANLRLFPGEIHSLVGENGAGKSTLIRIVAGVEAADAGVINIRGKRAAITSPNRAFDAGISVVHQERNLIPVFTVGENIMLDRVVRRSMSLIDRRSVNREALPYMAMVGMAGSPSQSVTSLSPAEQQLIEIARALSHNASVLLLDEPTASISNTETGRLLDTLRQLRDRGVAVLFVSHKLEEVLAISDSVTVLRDGRNAGPDGIPRAALDQERLIELMIGRAAETELVRSASGSAEVVWEVTGKPSQATTIGSSFQLHRGEILGWYGLVGAGRTELARAAVGLDRVTGGAVRVGGRLAEIRSFSDALKRWHIGYVSENRKEEGLFLIHSVQRNIAAAVWRHLNRSVGLISGRAEKSLAEHHAELLNLRPRDVSRDVGHLSGGNQQKVSLAKWLASGPEILVIDEPTVGIDIATKFEIHKIISDLAGHGVSVILISSDLREVIGLADRILVFRDRQIVGEMPNSHEYDAISAKIMGLIFGAQGASPAAAGTNMYEGVGMHGKDVAAVATRQDLS
jgi:ribose transport system ATP-binding protein